jgi:catecholate siderophore receptor
VLLPHPARALAAATLLCAVTTGARIAGAQTTADTTAAPTARPAPRPDSARAQRLQGVTVSAVRQRGYAARTTTTATRTSTRLRDVPQTVGVVTRALIADQAMQNMTDVARYVPGVTMGQGEGHRDAPTIRGNSSTADFFVDGVRDDAQYYRDLYDAERVEALKGANAMAFGRGGGGGVINRVSKEAQWAPVRALTAQGGSFGQRRATLDVGQGTGAVAARLNAMGEDTRGFRQNARLRRAGVHPTLAVAAGARTMIRLGYEHLRDDRVVDRGLPSFQGPPVGRRRDHVLRRPRRESRPRAGRRGRRARDARGGRRPGRAQPNAPGGLRQVLPERLPRRRERGGHAGEPVGLQQRDRPPQPVQPDRRHVRRRDRPGAAHAAGGAEFGQQRTRNTRETAYFGAAASTVTSTLVAFDAPTVAAPVTFRPSASDADNRVVADVSPATCRTRWPSAAGGRPSAGCAWTASPCGSTTGATGRRSAARTGWCRRARGWCSSRPRR